MSVETKDETLIRLEKEWVRSELIRTNPFVDLSDYDYKTELTAYRALLKAYDGLGDRPEVPRTKSGDTL